MFESVLGFDIAKTDKETLLNEIAIHITNSKKLKWFLCFNAHSYHLSKIDTDFCLSANNANWIAPDGSGLILASTLLGGVIRDRITGFDLFVGLSAKLNQNRAVKVFFLGSTKQNLKLIEKKYSKDFPNISVVGSYSPSFKESFSYNENEHMLNLVNSSKADLLWVGLTQPKQEKWIYLNRNRLKVKLAAPIGAVFDFYAGTIKRPHALFQKFGIETIGRFIQNPQKMWRRNLVSIPFFLWMLSKEFATIKFRNLFKK